MSRAMTMNLFDGLGKGWDLYDGGIVSDGTNDAFDDAYYADEYSGELVGVEQGGRELVYAAQTAVGNSDVSIARKVYVSDGLGFARFLTSVTNTSDHAVDYTLRVGGNLGSDGNTYVLASSDGSGVGYTDPAVTLGANSTGVITDDSPDGEWDDNDPINVSLYGAHDIAVQDGDTFTYTYNLHLAAGETKMVMNLAVMTETLGLAQAMAVKLSFGEQIYTGMSNAERNALVNWPDGAGIPASTHAGEVVLDLAGAYDSGRSAVLQSDGKLLVLTGGDEQATLIRVNADGTRDASFDVGNIAKGTSFALQADGKILVAGTDYTGLADGETDFSVMRLNADGTLDTGFGAAGKLTVNVNSTDLCSDILLQADGKILLVGNSVRSGSDDGYASLVRLNADGSPDTGFGDGGMLLSNNIYGNYFRIRDVAVQADGKLVVVGDNLESDNVDFIAYRLNADGTTDTTFGDGGLVAYGFDSRYDFAQSVAVQSDGKIVIAGNGYDDAGAAVLKLARLGTDGALDAGFGEEGRMVLAIGGSLDDGFALSVQSNGKILISGTTYDADNGHAFTRVQLTASGMPDGDFGGGDGIETTVLNGETIVMAASGSDFSALHLNADHTLVAAAVPGPTSGTSTVNSVEDTSKVLTVKDFVFHAVTAGTVLRAVKITDPSDGGHFLFNKLALVDGQSISVADINAGKLVFVPEANVNGNVHFGYQVSDGTLWSNSAGTLNFNIAAVRDDMVLNGHVYGETLIGDAIDAGSYDKLSGLGGDDTLLGLAGNDTLDGGTGNDWIDGGSGADKMIGGDGSDTYVVDDKGDVVSETNGKAAVGGVDLVFSHLADYTLPGNVENGVIDVDGAANLTGNSLDNILYAGAGVNDIDGSAGNDTVSFVYTDSHVGVTLNLSLVKATWSTASGGSGADRVKGVENIVGSYGNDTLTGTNAANVLDGGHGADRLTGGDGSDIYYVDNIDDIVVETNANSRNGGVDTVNSTLSAYQLTANVENGVILGEGGALTGNGGDNLLTGSASNDTLIGGEGNDTLVGGNGSDILVGGIGKDTLTGGAGFDTFRFADLADLALLPVKMDVITDFVHGVDKIDLSAIDANPALDGWQAFTFIGTAPFKGDSTGQLRFDVGSHILFGSTDADMVAEFAITLTGVRVFTAADLVSISD